MKKITLLLFVSFLMGCSDEEVSTEINQPPPADETIIMVSELNKWYSSGASEYMNGATAIIETTKRRFIHYFEGDTIINGQQYKKMYYKQRDSLFHQPLSGGANQFISKTDDLKYTAAFRQDLDMVYYIPKNQPNETLYANYNINVGDILDYNWNGNNETITAIESFTIGSNTINKYKLSNDQYFYENIGASYGLFKDWSVGIEGGVYLNCFQSGTEKVEIEDGFYATTNHCPYFQNGN